MSASLVGSEMCIRDRCLALREYPKQACTVRSLDVPQHALPESQRVVAPVSYTHLTLPTICSV
eukprot:148734-Alexandrium_andersonii.AAC.1